MFSNFEIICLLETWIEDSSKLENLLPGYKFEHLKAKKAKKFGRAAGGVAVLYKTWLSKYMRRIMDNFAFGIVLLIQGKLFNKLNDVVLIAVYLPPASSPTYTNENNGVFFLEEILLQIKAVYSNCSFLIMGDLNARIGNLQDFLIDNGSSFLPNMSWYTESDFDICRNSKDKVINAFGTYLVDVCCQFDIHTLNGRAFKDADGDFTYISTTGCSMVDYILVSLVSTDIMSCQWVSL